MLPFIVSDYFMNNLLKRTFNLCLPNIVFDQKCNIKQLLQGKKWKEIRKYFSPLSKMDSEITNPRNSSNEVPK